MAIYVQKHSFFNIACNLLKIKFPKARYQATFLEILKFPDLEFFSFSRFSLTVATLF